MHNEDSAIIFTLKYFEIIEKHLKITVNENGDPLCVIDWITKEDINSLRGALGELMRSDLEVHARNASIEYGSTHIQTVGFGLAPDFDQFVRLGLLYGDRVVLWDVLYSRILANDHSTRNLESLLAQIACNLLMLRKVVEQGAVVVLSHPIVWSKTAAEVDEELRLLAPVPAASFGLSMALAAIQDGLQLHPYTLLNDNKPVSVAINQNLPDELFSTENFRFQQCLTRLLEDQRIAYVDDVRIEDFFKIVTSHSELKRALRKHFSDVISGLSDQQANKEVPALTDDLLKLIDKRNLAFTDYVAEGVDASAKFALATAAVAVSGLPLLNALAVLGVPAIYLSAAVRKWLKMPQKNVVIQAFKELEKKAEGRPVQWVDVQNQISHHNRGVSVLGDLYSAFMSESWTEDRHRFLQTLSPEIAKALLKLLTIEDLEVIVNLRKFQEDYIGDYLAYLSELDEAIYWNHVEKSFESSEGILGCDDESYIEFMSGTEMPLTTWKNLLKVLFGAHAREMHARNYLYPLDRFPDVIRFQTENASDFENKRCILREFAITLDSSDLMAFKDFIMDAYDDELPSWVEF